VRPLTLAGCVLDYSTNDQHDGSHSKENGYGVEPSIWRLVKRDGDANACPE
jgi:hypothetical protein